MTNPTEAQKQVVEWGEEPCKEHQIDNRMQRKHECKYCWQELKQQAVKK